MNLRYTRIAAAVLCAMAAGSVSAADDSPSASELLDTIRVEGEALSPAMTPVDPERLSPGRESADALRDLLGVSGSCMGGHGTDVSIRGQSQTRINVLLDGAYVHGGCPNRIRFCGSAIGLDPAPAPTEWIRRPRTRTPATMRRSR